MKSHTLKLCDYGEHCSCCAECLWVCRMDQRVMLFHVMYCQLIIPYSHVWSTSKYFMVKNSISARQSHWARVKHWYFCFELANERKWNIRPLSNIGHHVDNFLGNMQCADLLAGDGKSQIREETKWSFFFFWQLTMFLWLTCCRC